MNKLIAATLGTVAAGASALMIAGPASAHGADNASPHKATTSHSKADHRGPTAAQRKALKAWEAKYGFQVFAKANPDQVSGKTPWQKYEAYVAWLKAQNAPKPPGFRVHQGFGGHHRHHHHMTPGGSSTGRPVR